MIYFLNSCHAMSIKNSAAASKILSRRKTAGFKDTIEEDIQTITEYDSN